MSEGADLVGFHARHRLVPVVVVDDVDRAGPLAEVLSAFDEAHAAAAPVHDMADVLADPHLAARGALTEVDGVPMQGLPFRLSKTPGAIRWPGPDLASSTAEWLPPD